MSDALHAIDFAALDASPRRTTQRLLERGNGAKYCSVSCIQTPPGEGSPEGLHTHQVDQLFFVIRGKMIVEIADDAHEAGPGTLVVFSAGVPHQYRNEGTSPTTHLSINAPLPDEGVPFATPVMQKP